MNICLGVFLVIPAIVSIVCADDPKYEFTTKYINVPVDHFSFTSNETFKLRYLINDTYYAAGSPIFFYTGNEGDISMFAQNTGFMFDIAPKFRALIVFAEHRYYGTSLPFGNLSYTAPKYLGYLTSQQALADFVYLINDLQKSYVNEKSDVRQLPVIAFGGSYGGMLSAWLRMKYPDAVVGAISSSAPIWQFTGLTPCENFYKIVTDVFKNVGSEKCMETLKKSWAAIRSETATNTSKSDLSKSWKLCKPLTTETDIDTIIDWLSNIYVNLVMVNYPYETSFLAPLPAYPVREFCKKLTSYSLANSSEILNAIGGAMEIYTNYTGKTKCNDIGQTSTDLGETGWNFQACTEMIMPMCTTDQDMFENAPWDYPKFAAECNKQFKISSPREDIPILEYGGKNLKYASNIVFSNGLMDPWSSGGVLSNVSSKILAIVIPSGAHHFDLRPAHAGDAEDVINAREFHVNAIKLWLDEFYVSNLCF